MFGLTTPLPDDASHRLPTHRHHADERSVQQRLRRRPLLQRPAGVLHRLRRSLQRRQLSQLPPHRADRRAGATAPWEPAAPWASSTAPLPPDPI